MIARNLRWAALVVAMTPAGALAQSEQFGILDNSFLVEEAFNQEKGIFQNIFTWTRSRGGGWEGSFTQEWPAPAITHQLSYTVPFAGGDVASHIGGTLLNYRYQVTEEGPGRPAIAPRLSVILPTGRAIDDSDRPGVQVNLPLSKQVGALYLHGNAGVTWLHGVPTESGEGTNLMSPQIGGSVIWNTRPLFNVMLESVVAFDDAVLADHTTAKQRSVTVSPGVRGGWNLGDKQLILGAAVPIIVSGGETTAAILTYFSYELPFTANR